MKAEHDEDLDSFHIIAKAEKPVDDRVDLVHLQNQYGSLFGMENSIKYDCYFQKEDLRTKLKLLDDKNENIKAITDALWGQRLYAGASCLFMSPVLICIATDVKWDPRKPQTEPEIKSTSYATHLVYRVKRCTPHNKSSDVCAIFVDQHARVYQNWKLFMENNRFGTGVFIGPKNGTYRMVDGKLNLEIHQRNKNVAEYIDVIASTAIIGCVAGGIGLGIAPTSPIVNAAKTTVEVVGSVCSAYTAGRGIQKIVDRNNHQQSIGLADRDARQEWLNVGTHCMGAISTGMNAISRSPIAAKRLHMATSAFHIGSSLMSAISTLDSIMIIATKCCGNKKITAKEYSKLCTNLFILTNSMRNYYFADEILKSSTNDITSILSGTSMLQGVVATVFTYVPIRQLIRPGSLKIELLLELAQGHAIKMIADCKSFSDLKLLLLNIADNLTLTVFNIFIDFIYQLSDNLKELLEKRLGEHYMGSLIPIVLTILSKTDPDDGNVFQSVFDFLQQRMKKKLKKCLKYERISDERKKIIHKLLKHHRDIAENIVKKTFKNHKSIDFTVYFEEIDCVESDLVKLKAHAPFDERLANEIVKNVRMNLSLSSFNNFFIIVKKYISKHAMEVQELLKRPIFVDVFVEDIYMVISQKQKKENLDKYLSEITKDEMDIIDSWINDFYKSQIINKNVIKCKECSGEYCHS